MRYFSPAAVLRWSISGLLLAAAGCVESYLPDVPAATTNYLVVDGFINGNGVTRVRLSRSIGLSGTTAPVERAAKITILDDAGRTYALLEKNPGFYLSDSLLLDPSRQYQLRITTSASVGYASELVPLKATPPIDKVNWQLSGQQVQLLLSTQDPRGQSRYYRWGLTETWQFDSAYPSQLEYDQATKRMTFRTVPIQTCWRTERPAEVRQGSTAQLSQDLLTDALIATLDAHDERFKVRYSVLVSQWAETAAEFAYYELLRKNTEAVGGVNDPLPVQLTGNVHRLDNAAEPVLGYVGAHLLQYKRIFIGNRDLQLPSTWTFTTPYDACSEGVEPFFDTTTHAKILSWPHTNSFKLATSTPIAIVLNANKTDTLGYSGSTTACVDCRVRGTIIKPSYW